MDFIQKSLSFTHWSDEKGIALPVATMLLAVISLMGAAAIMTTRTDIKIGNNHKTSTTTFYLAEAGLDYASHALDKKWDLDADGTNDKTQVSYNNQDVNWDSTGVLAGLQAGGSGSVTIVRDSTDPNLALRNRLAPRR